jgi:hypothetical protein
MLPKTATWTLCHGPYRQQTDAFGIFDPDIPDNSPRNWKNTGTLEMIAAPAELSEDDEDDQWMLR